jgi:hypothetical protein
MKCKHLIQPYQIQGLDFIHIYPVVQWLVKKAIETRAEMGDSNRSYALSQFNKNDYQTIEIENTKNKAIQVITNLKEENIPQRKYQRKDAHNLLQQKAKINSTLLEYGQENIILQTDLITSDSAKTSKTSKTKATNDPTNDQQKENNEKDIKDLINKMTDQKQVKVTANAVGNILGKQQNTLQQIANEYTNKEIELQKEIEQLEQLASSTDDINGGGGGFQHKQRIKNILTKQIEQKQKQFNDKQSELNDFQQTTINNLNSKIDQLQNEENDLNEKLKNLEITEQNVDKKSVAKLEQLIVVYDELKLKETNYKADCKEKSKKLDSEIEKLRESANSEQQQQSTGQDQDNKIQDKLEASKKRLNALHLKIAKKNREISTLKRKLDEQPSRIELTQYQKRFIELYNQSISFFSI